MKEPFQIDRTAVYDDELLGQGLGIPAPALWTARDAGELRCTIKAGRVLYLGQWILDWLQAKTGWPAVIPNYVDPNADTKPLGGATKRELRESRKVVADALHAVRVSSPSSLTPMSGRSSRRLRPGPSRSDAP
jgi:hypothetical protein